VGVQHVLDFAGVQPAAGEGGRAGLRPCEVNPGLSTLPPAPGSGINRRYEPRQDEASITVDAIQRKRIHASRALTPRARAGAGDTGEVDCQRAETHLRLLAEEELRRPASAWGERRIRVGRVADLLTAIGALDDEVADQIMADFDLALAARQADARGRRVLLARLQRRPAAARSRPAMPVSSGSPAPGLAPGRLVRLGQVIPVRGETGGGEVYLLSYARTGPGPQLSLFVRSTRQDGPSGPAVPRGSGTTSRSWISRRGRRGISMTRMRC
jgi:hypothetical protein